ncbi:Bud3p ASCRUDRAFT_22938, partial [Ascoidea rubescens DSM 1968]
WDETTAGEMASQMNLIINKSPVQLGQQLLRLGLFQQSSINSIVLDVVYSDDNSSIKQNNKLVFLLGDQLDQLFDPLTEYSPESTDKIYKPPNKPLSFYQNSRLISIFNDSNLISSICQELLTVQTNFTINLVNFLQNFVIPLRIKVLEHGIDKLPISKLNSIFPPTIDEVTRINCIFLDALKSAQPYGSFEIIKACGTSIPYFYKAYMRHEAATRNFNDQLSSFLDNFHHQIPERIDTSYFTKRRIETIIHGSLNLTKLKLILNRLINEKISHLNTFTINNHKNSLMMKKLISKYYNSSIQTIDSFGNDKLKPYESRVFTPTGKILTELANGWPIDLQYGWVNRRVISIFDCENLMSVDNMKDEITIIFSDHILFLKIIDENYYNQIKKKQRKSRKLRSSPITNIPKLKVSGWADISNVFPSTYNDGVFLQFFVTGNGIKLDPNQPELTQHMRKYKLSDPNKLNDGYKIIELINKAKILNKSSPFHLFK